MVGEIADVAADDRRVADVCIDAEEPAEPLRARGARLLVALRLARLVIELTPDMDRRGCPALEHRAGKRRDLAVGRMVGEVVLMDAK